MKKLIVLSLFLFFTLVVVPVSYADGSSDQGLDTSSQNTSPLDKIIGDLDSVMQDIRDEIDQNPNRILRGITKNIKRCLDLLDKAAGASDDGDLDVCDQKLTGANKLLTKTAHQFEAKLCSEGVSSRSCIPQEDDTFLQDLQDALDSLDIIIATDDDGDEIPDVCGLSSDSSSPSSDTTGTDYFPSK